MADQKQLEFFLLLYVPNAFNGEALNLGLVLLARDGSFAGARFTRDWSRVRALDPAADVEMLQAFAQEVSRQLDTADARDAVLRRLEDTFSNAIQPSERKACLGDDPQLELETLSRMYLEVDTQVARTRTSGPRMRLVTRMRQAFEQAGVWDLIWKKLPAARYGMHGDPLTLDFAYKPNGLVRLFHAITLRGSTDSAKALAFSYPAIRDGIARELRSISELTAIVDTTDRSEAQISFGLQTLERAEIKIATADDLNTIAARARDELLKSSH
jgi:hypothetical protein